MESSNGEFGAAWWQTNKYAGDKNEEKNSDVKRN